MNDTDDTLLPCNDGPWTIRALADSIRVMMDDPRASVPTFLWVPRPRGMPLLAAFLILEDGVVQWGRAPGYDLGIRP